MTIKDVKKEFIAEGRKILQHELAVATGGKSELDVSKISNVHHAKFVGAMLDLIRAEVDIQKINAKNTADILEAMAKGELDIRDAKELVSLFALINGDIGDEEDRNILVIEIAKGGAK